MSKPDIQQTVSGYELTWPEGIKISVSRLRVHNSDGRVTGEVLIRNKEATLYPQTQINFSADRTRNSLAKTLNERYEGHDWQAIIDQLSYHVQDKAREGEPVIELWTHEELKPPEYIVHPIIMKDQVNILFGPPESGKTQFAMLMCLIAMLPWYDNTLGLKVQKDRSNILWLDYEADRTSTLYNFTRIVRGADAEGISLNYRRCRMPLCDDIEAISNHVEQAKTDIVVIDSVAKAAGGDLDKSESPNRLFAALDLLNCTPLILAHTYKGEGAGKRTIYGSTFFTAYARSVWELRASQNGDEMTIGLWDNKANYRAKQAPMAFTLIYSDNDIRVSVQDIKTVEDFMAHLSTTSRIWNLLKDGPKSPTEIITALKDVHPGNIYTELGRMCSKNKIVKMGEGKGVTYGLMSQRT